MKRNIEIVHLKDSKNISEYATIKEIKDFLNLDISLEKIIYDRFPIEEVTDSEKSSKIKGSKELISAFKEFKLKKLDYLTSFDEVEYIGIADNDEILLYIKDLDIKASSIYNFSSQFYDKFKLRGYARHCIDINRHDIVLRNINEMLLEMKEEINQYRILEKDNNYFLRAFTSNYYQNYDNNIAVYLILYALEKLNKDKNYNYYIERGYIGDSSMSLLFTKELDLEITDLCKVGFSINLSNSEIADESLKVSLRYLITDNEGRTLAAMVEDPICRITHDMKIDSFERRYNSIFDLRDYEKDILDIIKSINIGDEISEDGIYFLLKKTVERVTDDKDIKKETKDKYKEFQETHLIESTLTIMKFFDKINSIETDMDERIFIERIFHQVIQEYIQFGKNRK